MDISQWVAQGGLVLVCLCTFASTGLFFCFFLPTGAVLFASGILLAAGAAPFSLPVLLEALTLCAIAGNFAGYALGRVLGPSLQRKADTWYFKQQHLMAATTFYQRHGGIAIAAGFFLPVIRTFSPVVAGIVRLRPVRFGAFSLLGSLLWILSFAGGGYLVGSRPFLRPYLPWATGIFILVVTVPLVIRIIREMRKPPPDKRG